jgi:hypothetical protein
MFRDGVTAVFFWWDVRRCCGEDAELLKPWMFARLPACASCSIDAFRALRCRICVAITI